jgi:ATP-dependent DNA helicase PIF1
MITQLTEQQKDVINSFLEGHNIFLTGPAGTGKSFIINHIIKICKIKKISYKITSSTGISAILIGGSTLHSIAGIQLGSKPVDYYIKYIKPEKIKMWRSLKVLIIDEVSMLNSDYFQKVNDLAQLLRNSNKFFGGIQIILSGDFLQLPPIKSLYIFETIAWNLAIKNGELKTHCLTKNMRLNSSQKEINVLHNLLINIREGIFNEEIKDILNTRIIKVPDDMDIKPTKIFPTRAVVEKINRNKLYELNNIFNFGCILYIVNKKQGIKKKYKNDEIDNINFEIKANKISKTGFKEIDCFKVSSDIINKQWNNFQCMKNLEIAIGAQVMLTKNISVEEGLANGSRGIVREIDSSSGVIKVEFLNGKIEDIKPMIFETYININKIIGKTKIIVTQFPLLLAWACTIHKIQGASLDYVEMDMTNAFEYGMIYTALSRIRNLDGLYISGIDYSKIRANQKALDFYKNL